MDYSKYFITKKRGDNDFIALSDDAPRELKQLIQDIHFDHFDGCLPNDWIYQITMHAFDDYDNYEDKEDFVNQVEADVYYHDLKRWMQEPFSFQWIDYCLDCFGAPLDACNMVQGAQLEAKRTIYQAVVNFMEENNA